MAAGPTIRVTSRTEEDALQPLCRWAERGIRIFSALQDAPDRLSSIQRIKVHRCAGGGKGGPWPMACNTKLTLNLKFVA